MKTSTTYTVRGSVRGTIASHVCLAEAARAAQADADSCARLGGGAYSDATIRRDDGDPLTDDEARQIEDALHG